MFSTLMNWYTVFSAGGPGGRKTCHWFTRQSNSTRSAPRGIHPWL